MKLFFAIDPTKTKKLKAAEVNGILTINNGKDNVFQYPARSGGWGNGPLPCGLYKLTGYSDQTGDAYSQFGVGWFASIEPQFATDRTALGIHPDGNVEGSLGCLVIPFKNLDDNIRCRNMIRDCIEHGGCFLTVMQISIPQGGKQV